MATVGSNSLPDIYRGSKSNGVQIRCDNCAKLELEALTFPVLCSSLPLKVNITKYTHIQALNLAHDFGEGHHWIDILIGSDYYWDIVMLEDPIQSHNFTTQRIETDWTTEYLKEYEQKDPQLKSFIYMKATLMNKPELKNVSD